MGHNNNIVFSESQLNGIEIWKKMIPVLKKMNIAFPLVDNNKLHKDIDLTWYYEREESSSPLGELHFNIKKINSSYHLNISDSDTFRIFGSKRTFNKFIDLSLEICRSCNFKYGIYWEESFDGKLIPGDLKRAEYILKEKYYSGYSSGLIIINKNEIDFESAKLLLPKNSELSLSDSGFYVYRIYGKLKAENFT